MPITRNGNVVSRCEMELCGCSGSDAEEPDHYSQGAHGIRWSDSAAVLVSEKL